MTFLHKLAQRLAQLRVTIAVVALVAACEPPVAPDLGTSATRVAVSPKTATLRTGQMADLEVVGFTSTGDTATALSVKWAASGGTIVDTMTIGHVKHLHYKTASQPGTYRVAATAQSSSAADTTTITVTPVPVASVAVSPATAGIQTGQTMQLTATPNDSTGAPLAGRTIAWGSSNPAAATVNGSGLVTAMAAGAATITATSETRSGAASITVTTAVVAVATVSVSPTPVSVTVGQTAQLTATPKDGGGNPLTGRVVTWGSSNPAAATVSGTGLVTAVAVGAATITATSETKSGTASVTVTSVAVATVGVSPATASVAAGQTVQLTATPKDASGTPLTGRVVTWGSSNPAVATVSGSGVVRGVAAGSATITATSEGQSGTAAVTVTPAPVATVSVSPATATVNAGQTVQLAATPKDANGTALTGRVVTWGSSNAAVATVSGSGLVTGVAAGTVTITATSEGQSGTAAVTVRVPVATVGVSPATASLTTGQTVQLTATPKDANGTPLTGRVVTWGSSNAAIATVNATGLVTGVGAGSATITATSEGQSGTAALTVTLAPVATVSVSPAAPSVSVGQAVQLTATPKDANGTPLTGRVVTWGSSNAAVAAVSGNGLVTGVTAGTATITATSETKTGTATVTVTIASSLWPHEPAGLVKISDHGFSTLNDSGWTNDYAGDLTNGHLTVVSDPTAPASAPLVAQFYYQKGNTNLCGAAPATESLFFTPVTTLYIGTWAKFSTGFSFPGGSPGGEVHFLYGNPQTAASVVVDLRQDGGVEFVGAGGTDVYSASGLYTVGAWTQVELLMDYSANTARLWINGQAVSFGGSTAVPVNFSGGNGGFGKVQVTPTWGGCGGGSPANDSWLWYDHIRVSGK